MKNAEKWTMYEKKLKTGKGCLENFQPLSKMEQYEEKIDENSNENPAG